MAEVPFLWVEEDAGWSEVRWKVTWDREQDGYGVVEGTREHMLLCALAVLLDREIVAVWDSLIAAHKGLVEWHKDLRAAAPDGALGDGDVPLTDAQMVSLERERLMYWDCWTGFLQQEWGSGGGWWVLDGEYESLDWEKVPSAASVGAALAIVTRSDRPGPWVMAMVNGVVCSPEMVDPGGDRVWFLVPEERVAMHRLEVREDPDALGAAY